MALISFSFSTLLSFLCVYYVMIKETCLYVSCDESVSAHQTVELKQFWVLNSIVICLE